MLLRTVLHGKINRKEIQTAPEQSGQCLPTLNLAEVSYDLRVFLPFQGFTLVYGCFDLSVIYVCSYVFTQTLPTSWLRAKKKKKKRAESRTNRWKRFQAQEGKHFGEVCLWTQFKIIIGKTQAYSEAWVGWTLFVRRRCCRRKSFSCCNTELCSCCCFSVGSADVSHWWHTQIWASSAPSAGLRSAFGFVRDGVEKQDGVWTLIWYFMCLNISPCTWGGEGKKRKYLLSSESMSFGLNVAMNSCFNWRVQLSSVV